jgi:hypothetical protein
MDRNEKENIEIAGEKYKLNAEIALNMIINSAILVHQ